MDIELNGSRYEILASAKAGEQVTVAVLLGELGLANKRLAVEVNGDLVPRSRHTQHFLHAGDRVEVVQAIGGG